VLVGNNKAVVFLFGNRKEKNEMDQIYGSGYVFLLYDKTKRMIEKMGCFKKNYKKF